MSLASNLVFLIIFGIAGYVIEKIYDFDPAEYWAKFGAASIAISLLIAYIPALFNMQDVANNVLRITTWYVNVLPGVVIGDLAGQIVSAVTRGSRR